MNYSSIRNILFCTLIMLGLVAIIVATGSIGIGNSHMDCIERGIISWKDDYAAVYTPDYQTETHIVIQEEENRQNNCLDIVIESNVSNEQNISGTIHFDNVGLFGDNVIESIPFSGDRNMIVLNDSKNTKLISDLLFMPTVNEVYADDLYNSDISQQICFFVNYINPKLSEIIQEKELNIRANIKEIAGTQGEFTSFTGIKTQDDTGLSPFDEIVYIPDPEDNTRHTLEIGVSQKRKFENEDDHLHDAVPGYDEMALYNLTHLGDTWSYYFRTGKYS